MILIAVTPPLPHPSHPARIAELLDSGWHRVHVRYPEADEATVERILRAVPAHLRPRLTLHSHFRLASVGLAGGIHLNRRWPSLPAGEAGMVSRSCHSIAEIEAAETEGVYSYVTLSPLFESISKPGYGCGSTLLEEYRELHRDQNRLAVIGLGGVTPGNLPQVEAAGFAGAAMLSAAFPANENETIKI